MIPRHCSEVSLQRTGFDLEPTSIEENLKGTEIYHKTGYLILSKGEVIETSELAVVRVEGTGYGMFKKIEEVEVLSLPEETTYLRAPEADAFNHNSLSRAVADVPERAAVLETEFDHITFVIKEEPIKVRLVDVVPPHPSKLQVLTRRALRSMSLPRPVEIMPILMDMTEMVNSDEIVYPCRATDMGEHSHAKFLHECPVIGEDGVLVGCDISRKIFYSHYKRRPRFVNICPKHHIDDVDGYKLIKCCLVEDGVEMEGDTAIVPWGVRLEEIREAIRMIIGLVEEDEEEG